jgi:hypothetical protein
MLVELGLDELGSTGSPAGDILFNTVPSIHNLRLIERGSNLLEIILLSAPA